MPLHQSLTKLRLTGDFAQHEKRFILAHQPLTKGCHCGYIIRYPRHDLYRSSSLTKQVSEILHRGVGAGIADGDDATSEPPTLLLYQSGGKLLVVADRLCTIAAHRDL